MIIQNGLYIHKKTFGTVPSIITAGNTYYYSWDGITWTAATNSLFAASNYGGATDLDQYIIIPTISGYFIRLRMTGYRSFTISNVATPGGNFYSAGYGNGVYICPAYSSTVCLRSTDDGATWINSPLPSTCTNSYWPATDGNGVWVICQLSSSLVARSTNNGVSWTAVSTPSPCGYNVAYGNGVFVISGTTNYFLRSTDLGLTWQSVPSGTGTYPIVTDGAGTWVSLATPTTSRNVVRSTDNGATFVNNVNGLPVAGSWYNMAYRFNRFIAPSYSTAGGRLLTSTDGGLTWNQIVISNLGWHNAV